MEVTLQPKIKFFVKAYKTLHKIAVRSYNHSFGGKINKNDRSYNYSSGIFDQQKNLILNPETGPNFKFRNRKLGRTRSSARVDKVRLHRHPLGTNFLHFEKNISGS